jgi:large subunit ribosomal protein L25
MEKQVLPVEPRQGKGKGAAHSLRRQGLIPGVIYGPQRQPAMVQVDPKRLQAVLAVGGAENVPFQLSLGGAAPVTVMVKELQHEPVTGAPLHADFWELTKGKKLHVDVAVHVTGTAVGISKGGILQQVMRELSVECLPEDIPESVSVDVTELEVGHSIHVRHLVLAANLRVLADPEQTVVTCVHPTVTKEAVPAEGEAVAEGEAAATAAEEKKES